MSLRAFNITVTPFGGGGVTSSSLEFTSCDPLLSVHVVDESCSPSVTVIGTDVTSTSLDVSSYVPSLGQSVVQKCSAALLFQFLEFI